MAYYLQEYEGEPPKTIKDGSGFKFLSTPRLKFLDGMAYFGQHMSLRNFLRTMKVDAGEKLWFPYSQLQSPADFRLTELPPYETFFSTLSQCNVLAEDHLKYQGMIAKGYTEQEVLKIMMLEVRPPTGPERYADMQKLWHDQKFETFYDYLEFYNRSDCVPLHQALKQYREYFYENYEIDIFAKISLPSLVFPLLMRELRKEPDVCANFFSLLDEESNDLVSRSICGGLSNTYYRIHLVNHSKIHEHKFGAAAAETVKNILCYDANAL